MTVNKKLVHYNLEEALEEIQLLLEIVRSPSELTEQRLHTSLHHLYQHVNTAWNARFVSDKEHADASPLQREKWEQFPPDLKGFRT